MPLGTEVGLGPGDIVLDGDPASPSERGTAAPHFSAHLLWSNGPFQQLLSSLFQRISVLIQRFNSILFHETFPVEDVIDTTIPACFYFHPAIFTTWGEK